MRMDRRTNMAKLILAFLSFARALKNCEMDSWKFLEATGEIYVLEGINRDFWLCFICRWYFRMHIYIYATFFDIRTTAEFPVSFTASILWRKVQAFAVAAHTHWDRLDDLLQLFLNEDGSVFSTVCVKTVTRFSLDVSSLTAPDCYVFVD